MSRGGDEAFLRLARQRFSAVFRRRHDELHAPAGSALAVVRRFCGENVMTRRQLFGVAHRWIGRELDMYRRLSGLKTLPEILADPISAHQLRPLNAGDEIVYQSRQDVENMVPTPTDFQREWLEFSLQLKGRRIYGTEWKTNQIAIKQRNNWAVASNGIGATMTGRKEGKSTAMAMDVIVTLFNIPAVSIALFSRTKPQACIILDMAKVLAVNHKRASQFKILGLKNSLVITHIATGDTRLCTAWSGDADVRMCRLPCCCCCCAQRLRAAPEWDYLFGRARLFFLLLEGRPYPFFVSCVGGGCVFFSFPTLPASAGTALGRGIPEDILAHIHRDMSAATVR